MYRCPALVNLMFYIETDARCSVLLAKKLRLASLDRATAGTQPCNSIHAVQLRQLCGIFIDLESWMGMVGL